MGKGDKVRQKRTSVVQEAVPAGARSSSFSAFGLLAFRSLSFGAQGRGNLHDSFSVGAEDIEEQIIGFVAIGKAATLSEHFLPRRRIQDAHTRCPHETVSCPTQYYRVLKLLSFTASHLTSHPPRDENTYRPRLSHKGTGEGGNRKYFTPLAVGLSVLTMYIARVRLHVGYVRPHG
jgi:hypothetical protein